MSILLIVVILLVAAVVLSRLTGSSLWGERRSLKEYTRAMDVLGSLPGRHPRPRGETGGRGSDQVRSSDGHPNWPDEAVVGDSLEVIGTEEDVRRHDASGDEVGASVETTSNSPIRRRDARDPANVWEAVLGDEVTGRAKRRRGPRQIASELRGYLLTTNTTRPRPGGWTPLLVGMLVVLAVFAIAGTLIVGLMTGSTKRPAATGSPTTAPITTPPTTAPTTAPPPRAVPRPVSATRDVWLKTGPGRAYGNIVILPGGAKGDITCYDPNGQLETSTDGTSSTIWWRTYYGQNVGWVSGDYLNTQGARNAPLC